MSSGADLLAALTPVADVLDRLGVAYQIGGSVASSVHGLARATMDVDLVAELGAAHVEPFVAHHHPTGVSQTGARRLVTTTSCGTTAARAPRRERRMSCAGGAAPIHDDLSRHNELWRTHGDGVAESR